MPDISIDVSFIIPAFNEQRFIRNVLASIKDNAGGVIYEIIVVDNGSTDNTADIAREMGATVLEINRSSISHARNVGAEQARSTLLAFLDADVRITKKWVGTFITKKSHILEQHILTGAKYIVRENPSYIEKNWFDPLSKKKTDYINGGNIIISKASFAVAGGFDTGFETGEDVEFCQRAAQRGISIIPDDGFMTYHDGFPQTIKGFMKREIWHGKGDYKNLKTFLASKVALTASFVGLSHYAIILLALFRAYEPLIYIFILNCILLTAISMSIFYAFTPLGQTLKNIPICYLYMVSRHLSLFSRLARAF